MVTRIELGDIVVEVVRKDIKNIHLSVYPPHGQVRISAPEQFNLHTLRAFAISKLAWIKKQQKKLREQERETSRQYVERESHYVWGKRYLMRIVEAEQRPDVDLGHGNITLTVRPGTPEEKRREIVDTWYRKELRKRAMPLISKWEKIAGVKVECLFIRKMKTKWGSSNPKTGTIRLNTDLAKKPVEYLEYIIVHEIAHLIEPTHNQRFVALMNTLMPKWHFFRDQLNQLPVSHVDWEK